MLVVALLLAVVFGVQARFVLGYPQPPLFGDPEGYYSVGLRLQEALSRLLSGELSPAAALESVRGVLYFVGPGFVFGALDLLQPGDTDFLRLAFAAFNTGSALVAFLLGRELSGRPLGGFAALALFALHPSFPVELAKLFPDPVTGLLFSLFALLGVTGAARRSARRVALAGASLGCALLVRPQLMEYMLALVALALLASARAWAFEPSRRRLAVALAIGLLPFAMAWGAILRATGDDLGEIESLGNFTFRPRYPYGFWQFLDSDGFMGPYRLGTEPYFTALVADARDNGWDVDSRLHQWTFTARYVAGRAGESALLLLDNAFRLYDRPPNRYKWDYPFAYEWQVRFHRLVVVLGLAGLPALFGRRLGASFVAFVPGALAILHGLSYPWPRFAQPALPLLLALAGASVPELLEGARRATRPARRVVAACAAAAVLLLAAGHLLPDMVPAAAAAARFAGTALALALPIALSARLGGRRTHLLALGLTGVLTSALLAHTLRGHEWHATRTPLGQGLSGVEQRIEIPPEERGRLREAPEAWLVLDLRPPADGVAGLRLEVGTRRLPGSSLVPTLPPLREFTFPDGPPRHGFAQWWGLPLDAELRAEAQGGSLRVRVETLPGRRAQVAGDRFDGQQSSYEGPSFGEWPNLAAIKFDYDGDSRLGVRRRLSSRATRSYVVDARGVRPIPGVHRIRVVTLANSEGGTAWRTGPAPRAGRVAFVFAAYSRYSAPDSAQGTAELLVDTAPVLRFPLESRRAYRLESGAAVLCHAPLADRPGRAKGAYALLVPAEAPGVTLTLAARFHAGLSAEQIMFRLDPLAVPGALASSLASCIRDAPFTSGAAEVLDETRSRYPETTGRFRVDAVY